MTLFDKFSHGHISHKEYCQQAYDILMWAIEITNKKMGYETDIVLETLRKEGDTAVFTRSEGARKCIDEAFGVHNNLMDLSILEMVLEKIQARKVNREESRTINSLVSSKENLEYFMGCKSVNGNRKENNEDFAAAIVSPVNPNVKMLIVCDGVGGYVNGEKASETVVKELIEWFQRQDTSGDIPEEFELAGAINNANDSIVFKYPGSATTLTCAIIGEKITRIANIGDSRLYTIKDDWITQLTEDDSLAWNIWYKEKGLEKERLRFLEINNIIVKSLGSQEGHVPITYTVPNDSYDSLLLTTDGITDILTDQNILRILAENPNSAILDELLKEACSTSRQLPPDYLASIARVIPVVPGKDNATAAFYTKIKH